MCMIGETVDFRRLTVTELVGLGPSSLIAPQSVFIWLCVHLICSCWRARDLLTSPLIADGLTPLVALPSTLLDRRIPAALGETSVLARWAVPKTNPV